MSSPNVGRITQVIGSTLDAQFAENSMPALYNALSVQVERTVLGEKQKETLWCEVAQHLGGGQVRAVSLGSTDGLQRGQEITDSGSAVTVPVGLETLGRVFNLVGEPIDDRGPVTTSARRAIHQMPPEMSDLSSKTEIFETGIKVIDLLCPSSAAARSASSAAPASARRSSFRSSSPARPLTRRLQRVRRRRRAHPRGQRPLARNAGGQDRRRPASRVTSSTRPRWSSAR
jgi:hypothetical protein